jgi:sugar-specific transcriptional regulator TrmB
MKKLSLLLILISLGIFFNSCNNNNRELKAYMKKAAIEYDAKINPLKKGMDRTQKDIDSCLNSWTVYDNNKDILNMTEKEFKKYTIIKEEREKFVDNLFTKFDSLKHEIEKISPEYFLTTEEITEIHYKAKEMVRQLSK